MKLMKAKDLITKCENNCFYVTICHITDQSKILRIPYNDIKEIPAQYYNAGVDGFYFSHMDLVIDIDYVGDPVR